ncbi:hypothetical protein ACHAPA_012317 [Fusarium lateritium]
MSTPTRNPWQIKCGILIHENGKPNLLPPSNNLRISLLGHGILLSFPRDTDRSVFTWYSPGFNLTSPDYYHVMIEMPSTAFTEDLRDLTQDEKQNFCTGVLCEEDPSDFQLLTIKIPDGSNTNIVGFGLPFNGATEEAHVWVNKSTRIYGVATLAEILQRRDFTLLAKGSRTEVDHLARRMYIQRKPLDYGYGKDQTWDIKRYEKQIPDNRGLAFTPTIRFEDKNQRDTALTQVHVQDVWDHNKALEFIDDATVPALI